MSQQSPSSWVLAVAAALAILGGSPGHADDGRPQLPDNKTIDTFQYGFSPKVLGSAATLAIHKDGRVTYSYASAPQTGSGGKTVHQEWKLAERDRAALLAGLVEDGLLNLEDASGGKFPSHYVAVTYGRWQFSLHPTELPEKILKRVKPLLQKAHPEEWGAAQEK